MPAPLTSPQANLPVFPTLTQIQRSFTFEDRIDGRPRLLTQDGSQIPSVMHTFTIQCIAGAYVGSQVINMGGYKRISIVMKDSGLATATVKFKIQWSFDNNIFFDDYLMTGGVVALGEMPITESVPVITIVLTDTGTILVGSAYMADTKGMWVRVCASCDSAELLTFYAQLI
jgi:hypothetical protein